MYFVTIGHATSQNEYLHRLLNRSCVVGATVIGHELLIAVLTILFYCQNKSKSAKKHSCNKKVPLVLHPRMFHGSDNSAPSIPQEMPQPATESNDIDENLIGTFSRIKKVIDDHVNLLRMMKGTSKRDRMEIHEYFPFDDALPDIDRYV